MSEPIKEFLVGLGFKVDEAGLNRFMNGVGTATVRVAAIGAAVTAAASAVFYGTQKIAEQLNEINQNAQLAGTSAKEMEKWSYAAEQNGSSAETATSSLKGLNKAMQAASYYSAAEVNAFGMLGVSIYGANGKLRDTSKVMEDLGKRLKGLDRARSVAILSKLGIDETMLPAITGGIHQASAELEKLYQSAGYDVNAAAKSSSEFVSSFKSLQKVISVASQALAHKFMGPLKKGLDDMRKKLLDNLPRIIEVLSSVIGFVLKIAGAFWTLGERAFSVLGFVYGLFEKLHNATDGWSTTIMGVLAAWKILNLGFLATPIGAIIGVGLAILALYDDFMTWKEGGQSLIDWSKWEPGINAVINAVGFLRDVIAGMFDFIFGAVDMIVSVFSGDFSRAFAAAGRMIDAFLGTLGSAWDMIKSVGEALGNFAGATVEAFSGDTPVLTPSPQAAAAMAGQSQTVNQKTDIIVQGSSDPAATARNVADQQSRVNGDMARNMKSATR